MAMAMLNNQRFYNALRSPYNFKLNPGGADL